MNTSFCQAYENFTSKYPTQKDLIENLYLKAILDSYPRIKKIKGVENLSENKIRNEFVYDLQYKNKLLLEFTKTVKLTSENQVLTEDNIFRTDIEFFVSEYGSFVIECKKLKAAEGRYIRDVDSKGGVERFTNLHYAPEEKKAGMIGFLVQGNPKKIVESLIKKVKAFHPADKIEELLKQKCLDWELSFQSKHICINKKEIHLYHLFFDFVNLN